MNTGNSRTWLTLSFDRNTLLFQFLLFTESITLVSKKSQQSDLINFLED